MSEIKSKIFNSPNIGKKIINWTVPRQYVLITILFFLISCSSGSILQDSPKNDAVNKYIGGVAADEARAALEGQMILSLGGTAADAVVAMAFTMMVTRPDAAGPGGGGICIYYDRKSNSAEVLDFLPRVPKKERAFKNSATIPGSFRGLFLLSSRFGRLRWEQLVGPAERLARFGVPLSSFHQHVTKHFPFFLLKKKFSKTDIEKTSKQVLTNNQRVKQHNFAEVLSSIRSGGPRVFYNGTLAKTYMEGISKVGGYIRLSDLVGYKPKWKQPTKIKINDKVLYLVPNFSNKTGIDKRIWKILGNKTKFNSSNEKVKALLLIRKSPSFFNQIDKKTFVKGGSSGLVAMDAFGNSASCVMTMNKPFGTKRFVGKTGIIPAAPDNPEINFVGTPIVMSNQRIPQGVLAASSVDENFPGLDLVLVLKAVLEGEKSLKRAVSEPRITLGNQTNEILFETNISKQLKIQLENKKFRLIPVKKIGRINVMYCKTGVIVEPQTCSVFSDPRHVGYAINSES